MSIKMHKTIKLPTDAGSRMHVLDLVESPAFPSVLNDLLNPTGVTVSTHDIWFPCCRHFPDEALLSKRCEPLVPHSLSKILRAWWLKKDHRCANEPNWDLATQAIFPNKRQGLVLIEAKAYVEELTKEVKGKSKHESTNLENHEQIGQAINEARLALSRSGFQVNIARDSHYQFSNRVAFAWKLAKEGIPVVLIYLGFTGDTGLQDLGEPLRDNNHWRNLVMAHVKGILPETLIENQIGTDDVPLWILIRSLACQRVSPLKGQRPQIVERGVFK